MPCDLLDFRCFYVNEIVGSTFLAVLLAVIFYFIIASKNRMGFDTTIALAFPILFILTIGITGFSAVYAFATVLVGFMLSRIFNKLIQNR